MTRNGKIARLPRELREELNRRLREGEPGTTLVAWLNALPEARMALAREFNGRDISEQNLSEWKSGGYQEWLARREAVAQARELAADAVELGEATGGRLTDHLATVLAARYAAALAGWDGEVTEEFRRKLRVLHGLCQDIVELRRGDHSGGRLEIERERLERQREKTEEEVVDHFRRWSNNLEVRQCLIENAQNAKEKERRLREIFGLPPKEPEAVGEIEKDDSETKPVRPGQTESNQIKPGETE